MDEEQRKEEVRDYLSELLPWETRDEEREILVEECREAILALSSRESTFVLPYAPPEGVTLFGPYVNDNGGEDKDDDDDNNNNKNNNNNNNNNNEKNNSNDKNNDNNNNNNVVEDAVTKELREEKIAEEAASKLEKLAPLPPLLENFELDTHVGLIERMFDNDQNLVEVHALLTGEFPIF